MVVWLRSGADSKDRGLDGQEAKHRVRKERESSLACDGRVCGRDNKVSNMPMRKADYDGGGGVTEGEKRRNIK